MGRLALVALLGLGCVVARGPLDIGHRGPGLVAVVYEREDPETGVSGRLLVYGPTGARRIAVPDPQSAHWLGRDALLVALRADAPAGDYRTWLELRRVDLGSGASRPVGAPGLYFDLAPDPAGVLLALGVETGELGESELQIRDLDGAVLARRAQTLDRPRWSPNGRHLVVARPSAGGEEDEGVAIEGNAIAWPRLFRLRRDLEDPLRAIRDGTGEGALEPGGSLPLWWDERGIWARQRRGLVRCDPDGAGCTPVYAPGEEAAVVDGCATGGQAFLLVRRAGSPEVREIHRVPLAGWRGAEIFLAPPGHAVAALDCTD